MLARVNQRARLRTKYRALYRSGDNTVVTLSIVDVNTDAAANDFTVDDISFELACLDGL